MSSPSVLVLGCQGHPHADAIAAECRRHGGDATILYPEMLPSAGTVTVRVGAPGWSGSVTLPHGASRLHRATAVWYERPGPYQTANGLPAPDAKYARSESEDALRGLWNLTGAMPECFWMNHPDHIAHGSRSTLAIRRAAQVGFAVPRTVLTNGGVTTLWQMQAECAAGVVYRPFRMGYGRGEMTAAAAFTAAVGEPVTERHPAILQALPSLLQERVLARRLVQAFVVGDVVFASATDRVDPGQTPGIASQWQPWNLPDSLEQMVLQLVHGYQLGYSVVSLAVTDSDGYVFLEHDPTGDFLGVHTDVPDLGVLPGIADELLRRAATPAADPALI